MTHAPPPWQPNPPSGPPGQFPPPAGGFPTTTGIPGQGGPGYPPTAAPPAYGAPAYGAPAYGAPAYGQPVYNPLPPPSRTRRVLGLMVNPKKAAQLALRPQNRLAPPDPKIEQVRLIRTLIGMAVVGWVALKYDSVQWERIFTEAMVHVTVSVVVAVIAVPVTALALVLLTEDAKRRETRRSMRAPMKSMGLFIGAGVVFAGCAAAAQLGIPRNGPWIALLVVGGYAVIWTGVFATLAFFMVPRHLFAAADGHLLMPSLLAPTLSWAVAAVDLASPGNNRVPEVVAAIVTLGAPVSITAMSVWEAKRTKELYGVSFRGGTQPTRQPAPPPVPPGGGGVFGRMVSGMSANPSDGYGYHHGGTGFGYPPRQPFPHWVHVLGVVFTCGFWALGYLIAYLRWKRRNPARQPGWY
ncbi:MAG: hypothetical protein HOV68_03385 [Streptomycetaceae bacterium]|nr:hypothetical protein [Streptomycetaceae bacterium]